VHWCTRTISGEVSRPIYRFVRSVVFIQKIALSVGGEDTVDADVVPLDFRGTAMPALVLVLVDEHRRLHISQRDMD
jgi:hypothetical protein